MRNYGLAFSVHVVLYIYAHSTTGSLTMARSMFGLPHYRRKEEMGKYWRRHASNS